MYKHFFKRLFDIIGALIILPFVLLEIIILAPFIWLTDRGPVFYNAYRAGKNYKPFKMFIKSPKTKYHEIGFYFVTKIKEKEIKNNFKSLDGDSYFIWVPIKELDKYNMLAKPIQNKVINNEITDNGLEHIVYRGY